MAIGKELVGFDERLQAGALRLAEVPVTMRLRRISEENQGFSIRRTITPYSFPRCLNNSRSSAFSCVYRFESARRRAGRRLALLSFGSAVRLTVLLVLYGDIPA
jgi:hypothetical protein